MLSSVDNDDLRAVAPRRCSVDQGLAVFRWRPDICSRQDQKCWSWYGALFNMCVVARWVQGRVRCKPHPGGWSESCVRECLGLQVPGNQATTGKAKNCDSIAVHKRVSGQGLQKADSVDKVCRQGQSLALVRGEVANSHRVDGSDTHASGQNPRTPKRKVCARRPNFDHPCRLNIDQGWKPVSAEAGCG